MITDPTTGDSTVTIALRLEIMGTDRVVVPGCEPTTEITSPTLANARNQVCKNVTVDLQDALDAIPGSRIEFGDNWGATRKRWFVLPAVQQRCCAYSPDYYKILRELPSAAPVEETRFDVCDTVGQGFCPSGDFKFTPKPAPDPYVTEGMPSPAARFYTP